MWFFVAKNKIKKNAPTHFEVFFFSRLSRAIRLPWEIPGIEIQIIFFFFCLNNLNLQLLQPILKIKIKKREKMFFLHKTV